MNRILITAALIIILTLAACSTEPEPAPVESSAVDPVVRESGEKVFKANCSSCHSATSDKVLVGPSMIGLASRAGAMVNKLDARGYIVESIMDPGAFLNEGFNNIMPDTYGNSLSNEELDALIAYLLTFE